MLSIILGLASFLSFADHGVHLARIDRESVALLEVKVKTDLSQDTLNKRLIFTAALAACGYFGYKYFNPTHLEIPAAPASADQILLNNKMLQINNELLRQNLPDMQAVGSAGWLKDSAIGKMGSWVWEFGKWSTQQAVIAYVANVFLMGSSSALGKMVKTIDSTVDALSFNLFHDRDLKWFLISRARITNLFDELETHAHCIQTGTLNVATDVQEQEQTQAAGIKSAAQTNTGLMLDRASYEFHIVAFEQTWQKLVERMASLVAFIEYKAHTTDQLSIQQRLLLGAQHIIALTNATAQQCEDLLVQASLDALPATILFELQRLRSAVSDELMLANKLEHEISW